MILSLKNQPGDRPSQLYYLLLILVPMVLIGLAISLGTEAVVTFRRMSLRNHARTLSFAITQYHEAYGHYPHDQGEQFSWRYTLLEGLSALKRDPHNLKSLFDKSLHLDNPSAKEIPVMLGDPRLRAFAFVTPEGTPFWEIPLSHETAILYYTFEKLPETCWYEPADIVVENNTFVLRRKQGNPVPLTSFQNFLLMQKDGQLVYYLEKFTPDELLREMKFPEKAAGDSL